MAGIQRKEALCGGGSMVKLLGDTRGYGDEQHEFACFFRTCSECRRGTAFDVELRIAGVDGGESGLDTYLAKEAAENLSFCKVCWIRGGGSPGSSASDLKLFLGFH